MSRLLICEIADVRAPEFGGEFAAHIAAKSHTEHRRASLCAWKLLALALKGASTLPEVRFGARGKPEFVSGPRFSLAHSGALAAALVSEESCGVDVERIRPEVAGRLRARSLNDAERAAGMDFFEAWTKKECIGKLDGRGISPRPAEIDTLDPRWQGRFFTLRISDSEGRAYALSALCADADELRPEWLPSAALAR